MQNFGLLPLGGGAGLRNEHFEELLEHRPACRWFEIISENFMGFGGYIRECFEELRKSYRIIPHGVCLSIGSTDPLDRDYLIKLRNFLDEIQAPWTSDHLCFTMVDHANLNDLIPLPFTRESAENVIERAKIVQDILGRPLLLENVTRYLTVSKREMNESEFINTILLGADCGLLLDVTNAYLNSQFHGYDALEFVRSLPLHRVGQMHLAGWEADGDKIIDSHDAPVPQEVWDLFKQVLELTGPTSALVEWDAQLPSVARLLQEADMATTLMEGVTGINFSNNDGGIFEPSAPATA